MRACDTAGAAGRGDTRHIILYTHTLTCVHATQRGRPDVVTHDMVHRTHLLVFREYYPAVFRNWWIDDWISRVYVGIDPSRGMRVCTSIAETTGLSILLSAYATGAGSASGSCASMRACP